MVLISKEKIQFYMIRKCFNAEDFGKHMVPPVSGHRIHQIMDKLDKGKKSHLKTLYRLAKALETEPENLLLDRTEEG